MQLTKIKLAGFKSFVDPTTILLPSNLVAIVGPNGCGKSNIIDAITWVMGESSAKYLRGEALIDVIFNGSSSRKPVGQAVVELIFDNQDGSLGGEFANYAEISIRRQLTRAGDSIYFLNGTRCRRRDIVDIFLGTGLGPRSYSIIGQNMISRVIEAKPDEMRVYLEEAAGVSKYKERRRETENRIQHTKDNLARINDVRAELEKQLDNLKRQANAAERFKHLKQEERLLKAQWYASQWRQFDTHQVQLTLQIQQQETGLEAKQMELGDIDRNLENKRDEQHLAVEAFSEIQRRYYAAGNDITRLEQEIRHHQERQQQRHNDINQIAQDWQAAVEQLEETQDQLQELAAEIKILQPAADVAETVTRAAVSELAQAEEASLVWQTRWDEFNQTTAKTAQSAQVEQARIQHIERTLASIEQRQAVLASEGERSTVVDVQEEIAGISSQVAETAELVAIHDQQLQTVRENIHTQRGMQQTLIAELDQVCSSLQKLHGQKASLDALQQTALGQRDNHQLEWLARYQLDKQTRLAQDIEVEAGWEKAVEVVLGTYLQAVCVDDLAKVAINICDFNAGSLCIFSGTTMQVTTNPLPTLLSKVKSNRSLESILGGIYSADSLAEALALRSSLGPRESVITPEGIWLSAAWLRISHEINPAAGVFQREQELKELARQITALETTRITLEQKLQTNREQLQQLEHEREQLQKTANDSHAQAAAVSMREKVQRERLSELQQRLARINQEQQEYAQQLEQAQTELTIARSNWQQATGQLEQEAQQRDELIAQREQTRGALQAARTQVNQAKDASAELQIRLQTAQSQQATLEQTILHMQTQIDALSTRKSALENELNTAGNSVELQTTLTVVLEQRLHIETELNAARSTTTGLEADLRALGISRVAVEHDVNKVRDVLETLRLEYQSIKVKSETLMTQLNEIGLQLEEVLQNLPEDINADKLAAELEQTTQRINRLGPINLVAIDEFATCTERKEYLDKQHDDLQEGLNTLEDAIAKIDKETRARFKETFDKVNERFQALFPTIFGGGHAYLELAGESILDSGITVMACPPGKRNSTIHLLSGGEKALTAIALVFSIFHLNPAPFCLLDEVDAPLDDANIGRFCHLVRTMSEKTQFVFISHNKLAIEMAHHLMGVTMNEPGVSRLVSVNIEEAISMAG